MSSPNIAAPPLLPGQKLTREEFLRRWDALPELKRAELVDGLVYMPSPVTNIHARFDTLLIWWLTSYEEKTPGVAAGNAATWLMLDSAPQPDGHLRILPASGGQSQDEGRFHRGAPELAVEVSFSSGGYDRGPKSSLYQRAGVQEYLVLAVDQGEVLWRRFDENGMRQLTPGHDGVYRSECFPGLWLNSQALLAGNLRGVRETLDLGLASEEHARFAKSLIDSSR
ncbi:MAG: Uma2 family endonuclease [Acidobacteria bacterium]|nr:Uma2 family endonuclease [Acidobacteriota bacterium]